MRLLVKSPARRTSQIWIMVGESVTSTELALHTDATDIVGMMCLVPAREGGLSGYAGAAAIYNELRSRYGKALLQTRPRSLAGQKSGNSLE